MAERGRYDPIRLNQTNRYAGYQFHACIRMDGMTSLEAYYYVILSIYQWIRERVPEEDRNAEELMVPAAEDYAAVTGDIFRPHHINIGFALDITPLSEPTVWTLRIKETDQGTDDRQAVVGRFFTTRIGVRLNEKGTVELGIKIDVTDPADTIKEVDFAFRPGFVRALANQPNVHFEQVGDLKYGEAWKVETEEDYRQLLYMLENEDNQLPLVIFTYARPETGKALEKISMEEFAQRIKVDSLSRLMGMDTIGTRFPDIQLPAKQKKESKPFLPYETDRFSRSAFAYGRAYVLGDQYTERFGKKTKRDFDFGDVLLYGAKKFRGGVNIIGYPGENELKLKAAYDSILRQAQSYSKHKAQYTFGSVLFESEARKLERQKEFQMILESGKWEEKERYTKLVRHAEELNALIDGKDKKIRRLEQQCAEEFDRGTALKDAEMKRLEDEIRGLRKELAAEQEKNRLMVSEHQWAKSVQEALEQMRKIKKLPRSNREVVQHFQRVFPDRLGFTERGETEASRCGIRPDHLWEILYMVANDLVDAFRKKQGNLTEEEVTRVAGCEMSFYEGSMTKKDGDLKKLRDDVYNGKVISVQPHIKLKSWKGEPEYQRLHFCYDAELKKIIIGYLGDHLESAATRYTKKR